MENPAAPRRRLRWILALTGGIVGFSAWIRESGRLVSHPADYSDSLTVLAHAGFILLSIALVAVAVRARPGWSFVPAALYLLALAGCPGVLENQRLALRSSGCANHSSQNRRLLWVAKEVKLKKDPAARLPDTADFDEFLTWTDLAGEPPGRRTGLYCPGRFDTEVTTGYVFVGGGLPLATLREDWLIAFCASGSHPGPDDFRFAITSGEVLCLNRAEWRERIGSALEAARSGRIPYSPNAVERMKTDLEKAAR